MTASRGILRKWTPEEDALLQEHWPTMGYRCKVHVPTRSVSSIQGRVVVLGIKRIGYAGHTGNAGRPVGSRNEIDVIGRIPGGRVRWVFELAQQQEQP
jgi:hypothetical protein